MNYYLVGSNPSTQKKKKRQGRSFSQLKESSTLNSYLNTCPTPRKVFNDTVMMKHHFNTTSKKQTHLKKLSLPSIKQSFFNTQGNFGQNENQFKTYDLGYERELTRKLLDINESPMTKRHVNQYQRTLTKINRRNSTSSMAILSLKKLKNKKRKQKHHIDLFDHNTQIPLDLHENHNRQFPLRMIFSRLKGEAVIYVSRLHKYPNEHQKEQFYIAFKGVNNIHINFIPDQYHKSSVFLYISIVVQEDKWFKCNLQFKFKSQKLKAESFSKKRLRKIQIVNYNKKKNPLFHVINMDKLDLSLKRQQIEVKRSGKQSNIIKRNKLLQLNKTTKKLRFQNQEQITNIKQLLAKQKRLNKVKIKKQKIRMKIQNRLKKIQNFRNFKSNYKNITFKLFIEGNWKTYITFLQIVHFIWTYLLPNIKKKKVEEQIPLKMQILLRRIRKFCKQKIWPNEYQYEIFQFKRISHCLFIYSFMTHKKAISESEYIITDFLMRQMIPGEIQFQFEINELKIIEIQRKWKKSMVQIKSHKAEMMKKQKTIIKDLKLKYRNHSQLFKQITAFDFNKFLQRQVVSDLYLRKTRQCGQEWRFYFQKKKSILVAANKQIFAFEQKNIKFLDHVRNRKPRFKVPEFKTLKDLARIDKRTKTQITTQYNDKRKNVVGRKNSFHAKRQKQLKERVNSRLTGRSHRSDRSDSINEVLKKLVVPKKYLFPQFIKSKNTKKSKRYNSNFHFLRKKTQINEDLEQQKAKRLAYVWLLEPQFSYDIDKDEWEALIIKTLNDKIEDSKNYLIYKKPIDLKLQLTDADGIMQMIKNISQPIQ